MGSFVSDNFLLPSRSGYCGLRDKTGITKDSSLSDIVYTGGKAIALCYRANQAVKQKFFSSE